MRGAGTEGKQDVGYSVASQTLGGLQSVAGSDELSRRWTAPSPGGGSTWRRERGDRLRFSGPWHGVGVSVLWLWVCGVLVGGMGGAGRRELPPVGLRGEAECEEKVSTAEAPWEFPK